MSTKEAELEKKRAQNTLNERVLEEYTKVTKERDELLEKINKMSTMSIQDLDIEREKNKKLQAENAKLAKLLREAKNDLLSQEQKLVNKDNEFNEMTKRFETKLFLDDKTKDRDSNIFMKFLGRKPVSTNSQDQKLVTILNHFENQKEKQDREVSKLKKELEILREKQQTERGSAKEDKDILHRLTFLEKVREELLNQVSALEEEREGLVQNNCRIAQQRDNLSKDLRNINQAFRDLDGQNKQLLADYQGIVIHKQQIFEELQELREAQVQNRMNRQQEEEDEDEGRKQNKDQSINETAAIGQAAALHTKQLQQSLPFQENSSLQKLINELCDVYGVSTGEELLQCACKTEQVMQAIPRMESILEAVCKILFSNDKANNQSISSIDSIIPRLEEWKVEMGIVDMFIAFKDELCNTLNLPIQSTNDTQIISAVMQLMQANQELSAQIEAQESKVDSKLNNPQNQQQCNHDQELVRLLSLMRALHLSEDKDAKETVKSILQQLNSLQQFIRIVKKLLDVDPETGADATLSYLMKLLEKMKMNKYADPDLILKIVRALKVEDPVQILPKIEVLLKAAKTQKASVSVL